MKIQGTRIKYKKQYKLHKKYMDIKKNLIFQEDIQQKVMC